MALSRKAAGQIPHEAHELNAKTVNKISITADEILKKDIDLNNRRRRQGSQRRGRQLQLGLDRCSRSSSASPSSLASRVGFYLVRDVSRGIASIVQPMQALGRGDLAAEVPHRGEKTEIGAMADALQVFKEALIAKKAADEAAAADAEAKIERGRRVDNITRDFESMIGEIVETVSSASTQLEASAGTLTSTAERSQELTTTVAAASEEASTNVQSVASATEEMASSVNEISRQVQESARMASEAVDQARKTNDRVSELSKAAAPHRRRRRTDQHHRRPDQPAGAQRHHRGGARRRGRPRLCGGRLRGEGAGRADREGHRRDRPADRRHPGRDPGIRSAPSRKSAAPSRRLSEISSTIAAAVEEQGAATQEISRNVQQAAQGTQQVSVQHHRRAARRQRDRLGLLAGAVGGAVAVRRQQPPQARGRQVPDLRSGRPDRRRTRRSGYLTGCPALPFRRPRQSTGAGEVKVGGMPAALAFWPGSGKSAPNELAIAECQSSPLGGLSGIPDL